MLIPDIKSGFISLSSDCGKELFSNLECFCEYRSNSNVSGFYLSAPIRKTHRADMSNPIGIFFPEESNSDLRRPIKHLFLINDKSQLFYLSRHDSIGAQPAQLEGRGMFQLQENVFIPAPSASLNGSLTSCVVCPEVEVEEIELQSLVEEPSLLLSLYAMIKISAPGLTA